MSSVRKSLFHGIHATTAAARRLLLGGSILVLGILAVITSFAPAELAAAILGVLMIVCGALQAVHALTLSNPRVLHSTLFGSAMSILAGLLLLAWGNLVFAALALLLGASWMIDGCVKLIAAVRGDRASARSALLFDAAVNLLVGCSIALRWPVSGAWAVYLAIGIRLLTTGWTILLARDAAESLAQPDMPTRHPDRHLNLEPHPLIAQFHNEIEADEQQRWRIDRYWVITLLLTFLAIHIGRMEAEWSLVGLASPAIAVIGDAFFALILAYFVIVPLRLVFRFLTRPLERAVWQRSIGRENAARASGMLDRPLRRWMKRRMRFDLHLEWARRSPAAALRRGLQMGMPLTAVIIAFAPLLGVSWYFDTETWATGAWERWAAHRTDTWREEMVRAVIEQATPKGLPTDNLFLVDPGIPPGQDFSFIVIGDTGEGDASQHALRDQFLALGARDDMRFLVLSSDVIYPQGAMKDYEAKFYQPFKGWTRPIYAIPGNHDWYDALDAFTANFFEPDAARTAMRARREADHRLSTTTESRIEDMIAQAARLRSQYRVPTGRQRAPFFEIQTDRFALLAVDTGILRSLDRLQWQWLRTAAQRSRGKFRMVIVGHPFYAGGHDNSHLDEDFAALHQFLRDESVEITMGGDTHDFEFYRERYTSAAGPRTMLHFVNGGGGAYISIGTALDWPRQPPVTDCAFYSRTDAVVAKLSSEIPRWKRPVWWWIRRLNAWPSSPEMLAPAFASNRAPFFQSFVEVRVELSTGVVRLRPYTADGRMQWRDLQVVGQVMPAGTNAADPVEFTLPLTGIPSTGVGD